MNTRFHFMLIFETHLYEIMFLRYLRIDQQINVLSLENESMDSYVMFWFQSLTPPPPPRPTPTPTPTPTPRPPPPCRIYAAVNWVNIASGNSAPSHYRNQCWLIVNWTISNKLQWNFNRNSTIFIEENVFENVVCNFPNKLSRGRCDNSLYTIHNLDKQDQAEMHHYPSQCYDVQFIGWKHLNSLLTPR